MQINRLLDQLGKHYRYTLSGRLGEPLENYINGGERSFYLVREYNFEPREITTLTPFFLFAGRRQQQLKHETIINYEKISILKMCF